VSDRTRMSLTPRSDYWRLCRMYLPVVSTMAPDRQLGKKNYVPLFFCLAVCPSPLLTSAGLRLPLRLLSPMLLGPVGFLAGTPRFADKTRPDERGLSYT
jgi:hypothetical protein